MVSVHTLLEGNTASTISSIGFVPTEVLHPEDEDYDLDLSPYSSGFPRFPVFPPRRGDLVFNVSNDEPVLEGETDEQRQQRDQRNAYHSQWRADEEQRQLVPNNLDDGFDMVGDQQVFKTPTANVAVAMGNLDQLSDTPEYQGVQTNIWTHQIAAMGQTTDLLARVQAIPTRRSPPTRPITVGPHHDPAHIVAAVRPSMTVGSKLIATAVVGTLVATMSKCADLTRR
jgi:hypothetical protein